MSDCRIPLGRNGQYEAIVSVEDYAYLTQWRWRAEAGDGKVISGSTQAAFDEIIGKDHEPDRDVATAIPF